MKGSSTTLSPVQRAAGAGKAVRSRWVLAPEPEDRDGADGAGVDSSRGARYPTSPPPGSAAIHGGGLELGGGRPPSGAVPSGVRHSSLRDVRLFISRLAECP